MATGERSRHPRRRSGRPRLAFSGVFDLRLERAVERLLQSRFAAARTRALRQRRELAAPVDWLGPIDPFSALVIFCHRGDAEGGAPDLDSAAAGWRLSARGWQPLSSLPPLLTRGNGGPPRFAWSGLLAFALAPDHSRLGLLETWHPGHSTTTSYRLIWHEGWLEMLRLPGKVSGQG